MESIGKTALLLIKWTKFMCYLRHCAKKTRHSERQKQPTKVRTIQITNRNTSQLESFNTLSWRTKITTHLQTKSKAKELSEILDGRRKNGRADIWLSIPIDFDRRQYGGQKFITQILHRWTLCRGNSTLIFGRLLYFWLIQRPKTVYTLTRLNRVVCFAEWMNLTKHRRE